MRITSDLYTGIAGKIGGLVGMMNKSGMCFRQRVIPANPNTAKQTTARNNMSGVADAWSGVLTAEQRAAWAAYAATLEYVSKLGTKYTISGFGAYCAANNARLICGLTRVDDAPSVGGFASFTPPTITFTADDDKVNVAYINTDDWAGEVGGAMTVRLSPIGFRAGVTFYEGPFSYLNKILGAGTPPTPPGVLAAGINIVTGTQYACAIRVVRADGRYSQESIFRGLGLAT